MALKKHPLWKTMLGKATLMAPPSTAVAVTGDIQFATVLDSTAFPGTNTDMNGWMLAIQAKNVAIGGTMDATKVSCVFRRWGYVAGVATQSLVTILGAAQGRKPFPKTWANGIVATLGMRIGSVSKIASFSRVYVCTTPGTTVTGSNPVHTTLNQIVIGADGVGWRYVGSADLSAAWQSPYLPAEPLEQLTGSDALLYVVLDNHVFDTDEWVSCTVSTGFYTGVRASVPALLTLTNNSTWADLKPDVGLITKPYLYVGAAGIYNFDLTGYHPTANGSRPFDQVTAYLYNIGGSAQISVSGTPIQVTATSTSVLDSNMNTVQGFRCRFDLVALGVPAGQYTVRFKAFAFGGASAAGGIVDSFVDGLGPSDYSAVGTAFVGNCIPKAVPFRYDPAGTYGQGFAYVNPVLGSDTLGACSTIAATAALTPFATIDGAMEHAGNGLKAFCNSNFSRNNVGNCIVRLADNHAGVAATYADGFGASMASLTMGDVWVTIEADPTNTGPITWTPSATTSHRQCAHRVKFNMANMAINVGGGNPVIDNVASNTQSVFVYEMWFDGAGSMQGAGGVKPCQRAGLMWFSGGLILDNTSTMGAENTATGVASMIGCNLINGATSASLTTLGCKFQSSGLPTAPNCTKWNEGLTPDIAVWMFNSWPTEIANVAYGTFTLLRGLTWVMNFVEANTTGGAGKGFQINADASPNPMGHIFYAWNTSAGDGFNLGYNETGTTQYKKTMIFEQCNSAMDRNDKQDWHDPSTQANENRTGSMAYRFKVGAKRNNIFSPTSAALDPRNLVGEVKETGTKFNGTVAFVDDKSRTSGGTTTGGGNYRPTNTSGLKSMCPAAELAFPKDLFGNTHQTDDTAAVGAFAGTW